MKKSLLGLVLAICSYSLVWAQSPKKSILFLGNSYTGVNNLPATFYNLAAAGGDTVIYDSNTPGGYTLGAAPNAHVTNATSLSKIASRAWDVVVLQEQSQLPTVEYWRINTMYPGARDLDSLIKLSSPCGSTLFYLTWGRKVGGQQCLSGYCSVDFADFNHMQDTLTSAYSTIAYELNAGISPVGEAWRESRATKPWIELFSGDGSHPSMEGTYLAACVFYCAVFKESPLGFPYTAGIPDSTAAFLQQVAADVVLSDMELWNLNELGNNTYADFGSSATELSVSFEDLSVNADSVQWSFGDGNISTETNPVHVYATEGTYMVELIAFGPCRNDTIRKEVLVELPTTGIRAGDVQTITVYPNPAQNGLLLVRGQWNAPELLVFNSLGQQVKLPFQSSSTELKLDVAALEKGIYHLWIRQGEEAFSASFRVE